MQTIACASMLAYVISAPIIRCMPSATATYGRTASKCGSSSTGRAEFDEAGQILRIRGLRVDITKHRQIEEELASARKIAEEANRAKSAFLAAASHDLRQPLQAMRILQGTLAQQIHDSAARKSIVSIGRSLETMTDMLTSLLDINQLEAGNLRPSTSDFSVSDILDELAADFCEPATEKGLRWRLVRSRIAVHSDRRMLKEMIRNLLSNAIRYTDRGSILVGCRRAGDKVRIEVWDSGVGIMGEQMPRIFEEHYQGSAKRSVGRLRVGSRHRAATGKYTGPSDCRAFHTWQGLRLLH